MDVQRLKNINVEEITLLGYVYGSLVEYLDVIHPSKIGGMNRHFYLTNEEQSDFLLDKNWHNFLSSVTSGLFADKDLYMQIESDYNETLNVIANLKRMKKSKQIDNCLKDTAWELLDKLIKIRLLLNEEEVKRKQVK